MSQNRKRRIEQHLSDLASPDPKVSEKAERYLIRYYRGEATAPLIEACNHSNPVVRFRAVWALGASQDPDGYEAILRLTDDPEPGVRYDAVLALGKLGDPRAIGPLVEMATMEDASRPATEALADFGHEVISIAEEFYASPNQKRRYHGMWLAAQLIQRFGPSERCLNLLRAATADPDPSINADANDWIEGLRS